MEELRLAVEELEAFPESIDPRELSALIDRQQAVLCRLVRDGVTRGDHLIEGKTANAWVREACRVSSSSAADRLCVGEQLAEMPRVADAVRAGEIGYQSASVLCHFRERLREDLRQNIDEDWWVGQAREMSIKNLRWLEEHTRFMVDPEGAERRVEEDYDQRYLYLSELGSMYRLDAMLDRECGIALKTALESLTKRLGPTDERTPKQRRADALREIVVHAMDKATLPKRNGSRPHLSLHATVDCMKAELGDGSPVTRKTAQRLACDSVMHRVLQADSIVIDVGRARRTAQPAQWRALRARHHTCAAPGCERPIGWTNAHHVDFWSRGGETKAHRMVPLCFFHHRLVHEGGWQVILAGTRVEFVPPDLPATVRRRWGENRWAA